MIQTSLQSSSASSIESQRVADCILRARDDLASNYSSLEERVCKLFGARCSHHETPIMRHGWERIADSTITEIAGDLLSRSLRVSFLEVGGGTTWGLQDPNSGTPGLSRALKHAFPSRALVTTTDRIVGYSLFLTLPSGELVHIPYRDDRPPLFLDPSPFRYNQTLVPIGVDMIALSALRDTEFAGWIAQQEKKFGTSITNGTTQLFIRPQVDSETEALLFGVKALSGIDYLSLTERLWDRGERCRYDLIFGRHLFAHYLPSRNTLVTQTLSEQLQRCARHAYVQFDACHLEGGEYGEVILRHHQYAP